MAESRSNFLTRALGWLRAGYPDGVPKQDYVVLLGLLRRTLTEDEIRGIAADLAAQAVEPITARDIEEMVSSTVLQEATPEDVVRVSAHLAAGGWPLADPPDA
ncbi:hypothetical protein AMIS_18340 [Actinoplanes missouriensis 431]|uniref:DUF3349 domain-containing protein n=1 Tax=Actinoplanes missouriensis (strain ATCC 14538 / DSM 43046 / CBS 188.64 / JCM 3121 / NBRC 102363 / NCIMB 12654 / NRRL B-3342 / UNCC 431) TaxID=512565 RepID=I0H217_ACTM4|nr:DUF3349 domain-containing protein [Actinoplanes missouriensis]BAL87054.1 hypothetical protein AMIS_18340 [Actinoplanes missouriensis 431]